MIPFYFNMLSFIVAATAALKKIRDILQKLLAPPNICYSQLIKLFL